ncbi:MAG: glycosyltransferase, partial [Thermoanaerobaculia bacterium]
MGNSLVLLPTYNERENLPQVLPRLAALEDEVDVLVIDDASPDGTGVVAEELRTRFPRLSVLHRRSKEGLGRAYLHGFKVALAEGYGRIVTMDADLSHAPEDVPRLLGALEEADLAVGSRHAPGGGVEGWPFARRLLSRAGSLYARTLLRLPVSDATSGFRAYRADALRELDLDRIEARGFVFQVEILRRLLDLPGARAAEVPIVFRNRARGRSKLSGGIIAEAAREVAALTFRRRHLPERRYRPLRSTKLPPPRVSVVVPARPGAAEPEALKGIETLKYPREKLEVVIARGASPSRQRNLAVAATSGDLILFLDDDSVASPDLLRRYSSVFERDPTVGAVGGPAESLPGTRFQDLASLVLGSRWVVGRTASRYRARGRPRFSDERELILCNLCV